MDLLEQAYNQDNYLAFLASKFNFRKLLQAPTIDNEDVQSFQQLGFITTADNKQLPVFEIYIKPNTQLARNRVQLRNLVAKQVQTQDGALAVYVDDKNAQWRFSFIAIEYKLNENNQPTTEQTASKRFTYLLGRGTQIRTAKDRFNKINKQSTLADLKETFAVEPLSKEFYDKLYKWYQKAQPQVIFPNDEHEENHKEISLIRLLTRLLFIWFLKEKHLVNPDLFNLEKLKNIIDWHKDSSFYKAILQNLFFATLSVEIDKRDFRSKKNFQGKNKHYGKQYYYRYHDLVINKTKWQSSFSKTPFLNGGLFESLDRKLKPYSKDKQDKFLRDKNGNKIINSIEDKKIVDEWNKTIRPEQYMIRQEGFSEHKENPLDLANDLFFNNEQNLGLCDIFNQYQFTIEESTPLDIEVALDPELLGKVFENLLASYNPETGEQARKATGSFYTPREIVSYMVDESLKAYLIQKVPPQDGDNEFFKDRLNDLFNASDNTEELSKNNGTILIYKEEIPKLIAAISKIKILDPAVGSGAYPMGLLQRMVVLLAILDPDNKLWQAQKLAELPDLASLEKDIKITEQLTNVEAKQKAQQILEDKKQTIISNFKNQDHKYLRKLYLIESCIYGVDIQPIAILIAQLRFFISLTIEQEVNKEVKNFGIESLPNLDYHFEVGNSLLGLPAQYHTDNMPTIVKNLLTEIKPLKHQFFIECDHNKKDELKKKINHKIKQCYKNIQASIGYLINFDFKIDFNEVFTAQNGFDIVIGNPPYIRQEKIKQWKEQFKLAFQTFTGTADIYTYFYEKGFTLLSQNGHLCYITSNKWMRAKYGKKLRYFFKNDTSLQQIIDFEGRQVFENATVDTNILLCSNAGNNENFSYQKQLPDDKNKLFTMAHADLSINAYTLQPPAILALKKKIEKLGTPLKDWDINIYRGVLTGFNEAFIIDTVKKNELVAQDSKSAEIIRPILRGKDIKAYEHNWAGLWIINSHNGDKNNLAVNINDYPAIKQHLDQYYPQLEKRCDQGKTPYNLRDCSYMNEFSQQKIVYSEIVQKPQFYFDDKGYYAEATSFIMTGENIKFLIGILHSKLITYAFKLFYAGGGLGQAGYRYKKVFLQQLPIPQISKTAQQPFINLVNKILIGKQQNQDTTALEAQIDKMVYKLYNLSTDEIAIIEKSKN